MSLITVETQTLRAIMNPETNLVSVFQARNPEAKTHKQWFLLGNGTFDGYIIKGSGINCGVLAHLEPLLTARVSPAIPKHPIIPIS